jgi:hypothetical protein
VTSISSWCRSWSRTSRLSHTHCGLSSMAWVSCAALIFGTSRPISMRSTALLYNCSSIAGNLEKGIQDNHRKQAQWTGWCCSRQGSRGSTSGRRPGGNSRSRVNRIRGSLVENNDVCRTHSTVVLDDEDRNNDVSAPSGRSRDARARRADRPACPADWASAALQVGGANHPPPPPAHSAGLRNPLPV